jgi:NAD(P)-dependent dehydrogenase (short-subunit alcohol dehydrogenase family)
MTASLIWISGASRGIGAAMARTVPWPEARVIGISRAEVPGLEHIEADLAQPSSWGAVGESFRRELAGFTGDHAGDKTGDKTGERIVFVHAAGTVEPIGFAGEVDTDAYAASVILGSAAPQVLGHLFLRAVRDVRAERHLVMVTSGAARSVYPGWTAYGAGTAAIDQWVRNAGAEQEARGGVRVLAVGPGNVDTAMQARVRETTERDFPKRQKFIDLHQRGGLTDPDDVARDVWALLERPLDNGSVVDLREVSTASAG